MNLVIVESPTKAQTIKKFLGKGYETISSYGHIRDLPKSELGVDVEKNFEPKYVIPAKARRRVKELKNEVKKSEKIILAFRETGASIKFSKSPQSYYKRTVAFWTFPFCCFFGNIFFRNLFIFLF